MVEMNTILEVDNMANKTVNLVIENLLVFSEQEMKKNPSWRKGQALYNCAYSAFLHLVSKITGTESDCFYEDSRIPKFIDTLKETMNSEKPFVGIFWFYYGLPLFVHAVHLESGEQYGKTINGVKDHADYWEEEGCHTSFLPKPLQKEYFLLPRGRVVYQEDTKEFIVYHGNTISKEELQEVAAVFCLPKANTKFETDLHYYDLNDEEWKKMTQ